MLFDERHSATIRGNQHAECTGGGRPRDYQDERFSYVVLQRGERPQVPADAYLMARGAEVATEPPEEAAHLMEGLLEASSIEEVGCSCVQASAGLLNSSAHSGPCTHRAHTVLQVSVACSCLTGIAAAAVPTMQPEMLGSIRCYPVKQQPACSLWHGHMCEELLVCLQDASLQDIEPDEETLQLILESIRNGADDSDEDEMQQVGLF
jgi:hypothetical protein